MKNPALSRIHPESGWVDPKLLPKGPNGFNLCRYCKAAECQPPKRTFCSPQCIHEWKIRTQPPYARKQVFKRDGGRCAVCGEIKLKPHRFLKVPEWDMDHIVPVIEGGGSCGLDNLRTLCREHHREVTAALATRRAQARKKAA